MEVRDPIHGGIELDGPESALLHQPFLQRLRSVRQVGYSQLPFPGATHSRFAHVVGVMHLAGIAFDRAYRGWQFTSPEARSRLRAAVRLAALCHDLGHAPYSHCTEFAMPHVSTLGLSWYRTDPGDRHATHEDYTVAILQHTGLGEAIARGFPCGPRHVAALVAHAVNVEDDFFVDGGLDHRRLLSQLVSSELDVDRLDYLVRDAYFTGAQYGAVDVHWILSHLSHHVAHGQVWLAVEGAAIYAVEDFLVARHHMFLQVYLHHTSVVYEEMLKRWVGDDERGWAVPSDLDAFLWCDDHALEWALRHSDDQWARRLVEHRPFRRVVERHGQGRQASVEVEAAALAAAGIEALVAESSSRLSRYALARRSRKAPPIYVHERLPGLETVRTSTLEEASAVFDRYAGAHSIGRVFVAPEDRDRAWAVLGLKPA
jgi:HD superfamily phosphohydrolase